MCRRVWNKLTAPKNPNSPRYKRALAQRICGHRVRYVTERRNDVEEVIGKEGSLCLRDDELLVYASSEVLMRCPVEKLTAAELLSKDGVILTGPDLEHGGVLRTVIAYYVYYR